ncbi:MAG: Ig-like domain-containing protein [Chitinophagaceae bacterium]|jgi:hypothetical protein|nr:Ig-like domain-containing protein [Chitinophagaceae bacterium]
MTNIKNNTNKPNDSGNWLFNIYNQAIKNFPLLKFSKVIIAAIAILAIVGYFKLNSKTVIYYAIGVMFISFLGFLFSYLLTNRNNKYIRFLIYFLLSCIIIVIGSVILLFGVYIVTGKHITFFNKIFNKDTTSAVQTAPNSDSISVTGISLNKTTLNLNINKIKTLTATVAPGNATEKTVTWSSNNTDIATVDTAGKVTAVAEGTAVITAIAGEKTATCTVTVKPDAIAVTNVILNTTALSLAVNKTAILTATVAPDNATEKIVTWSSNNTNIATVDNNGKVTAVAKGVAAITAKAGEKIATGIVTVVK